MDSKIFFKPRYDKEKYEKGYKGYRTLILGVFHVCRTECKFREDCFKNTAKYDRECPVYDSISLNVPPISLSNVPPVSLLNVPGVSE